MPRAEQAAYFGGGDGDELTMQFDFIAMQATWLSLARGDARPLVEALRGRPDADEESQWVNFLRNHDELTLDKLTDDERQEVFDAFGPDPAMQLYGRGLRRRLPPMLDGDPRRIRLAYSLMFSLPGSPVLFYGEEIGMGENLEVPGRYAVRTPMQWSSAKNAGFSKATKRRLPRPVTEGAYGPEHVNVASQRSDPDSLWTFIAQLIRRYRQSPELGWGRFHRSTSRSTRSWHTLLDLRSGRPSPSTTSARRHAACPSHSTPVEERTSRRSSISRTCSLTTGSSPPPRVRAVRPSRSTSTAMGTGGCRVIREGDERIA